MKSVKTTKTGKNFTAVSVGKLSEVKIMSFSWATFRYQARCS